MPFYWLAIIGIPDWWEKRHQVLQLRDGELREAEVFWPLAHPASLVHDALLRYWESEGHQQPAFLDLSEYLFDDPDADPIKLAHLLIDFFGKNGFEPIPDDDHDITYTCMVLDPKNFKDPDAE